MAKALMKQDIEVDFLFSGRKPDQFFDMECFGDYRVQAGMTFATHSGRVNVPQTVRQNLSLSLFKDIKALDLSCWLGLRGAKVCHLLALAIRRR